MVTLTSGPAAAAATTAAPVVSAIAVAKATIVRLFSMDRDLPRANDFAEQEFVRESEDVTTAVRSRSRDGFGVRSPGRLRRAPTSGSVRIGRGSEEAGKRMF